MEICLIGKTLLKIVDDDGMIPHFVDGPCSLMVFEDGKVRCGAVIAERAVLKTDIFGESLGIGKGCCSDDLE